MKKTKIIKQMWADDRVKEAVFMTAFVLLNLVLGQLISFLGIRGDPAQDSAGEMFFVGLLVALGTFIGLGLLIFACAWLAFEVIEPAWNRAAATVREEEEREAARAAERLRQQQERAKLDQIYREAHVPLSERELKDPDTKRPGPLNLIID